MMPTKLAIAIPTYNRAEMLKFNLLHIIDELIEFQIPVYISDDSTNNETAIVIQELKTKHELFYYRKNEVRFGHDLNCIHTISFPKEEYVWYMGDSMIIKKGSVKKVLACMQNDTFDFIVCNSEGRNLNIESRVFTKGNEVFDNLCWHMTMTGITIYNKNSMIDFDNFKISNYKNFPQTALVFEQFAKKKSKLYWINDKLIYSNPDKSSYWASKVFEVFIDDFRNFVYNLPNSYSLKSKDDVLTQHTLKTGIFSYHSFVLYRTQLYFDYGIYIKYKKDIIKYAQINPFIVMGISLVWAYPLRCVYVFLKKLSVIFKK